MSMKSDNAMKDKSNNVTIYMPMKAWTEINDILSTRNYIQTTAWFQMKGTMLKSHR